MKSRTDRRKFKSISRRELLKLTPVAVLGAFAIPQLQKPLLKGGLAFSDWISARLFRTAHLAPTFADLDLTPFEKFPINGYDVDDPGVDFDKWTLTVGGSVQKPGDYTLVQIQALPKLTQNTRHVCVEGWDVIGNFGGVRLSDFLRMIGADPLLRRDIAKHRLVARIVASHPAAPFLAVGSIVVRRDPPVDPLNVSFSAPC